LGFNTDHLIFSRLSGKTDDNSDKEEQAISISFELPPKFLWQYYGKPRKPDTYTMDKSSKSQLFQKVHVMELGTKLYEL